MSHIDELDEFEAELELTLKKEYSAVFELFRYCVLTQDATYLCNKLDLNYVPQPSYPFFHLKMEDVWVWDKNRPTRIIPRAEIYTSSDGTGDEVGVLVRSFLDPDALTGICLSSTVPPLVRSYEDFAAEIESAPILVLGPGVRTGIPVRYDDPREVGPDRIANAVAAVARYGAPCIVVDFGTSTNFDVVSAESEYVGGVLAPGIEISMEALSARAARLFRVDFSAPDTVIAKNTAASLQSGLVYGFAGQVDGIVERIRGELGVEAQTVATGGMADLITPHARTLEQIDPFLTLEGVRLIWERNSAP